MKNIKSKAKIVASLAVSFVMFLTTFFAMAENKNANSLFLDSDQDGLTDQEEKMLGTDPQKNDTDNDGYSDGKEVESGYNPLKAAPGDKIGSSPTINTAIKSDNETATDQAIEESLFDDSTMTNLDSDPSNPNLTNEMIGKLMQLTKEKADSSESFIENPTYTSEDFSRIAQEAIQTANIADDLPDIKDDEINALPPIEDEDLSAEEIKEKQREEIEKYLAQSAFLLASNSPFAIDNPESLESNISAESSTLLMALTTGDAAKIDSYAQTARAGIDQMKKIEVPYVLKDIHKSILQLAIYTLDLKDSISLDTEDPMKSLAAVSKLQTVAQSATKIQEELTQIMVDYEITEVEFP